MEQRKEIIEFEKAKDIFIHELAKAFKLYKLLDWLAPKADRIVKRIDKLRGR